MEQIELSIILPVYNEEKGVADSLNKIFGHLESKNFTFEVIAVDDGSSDATSSVLADCAKKYPRLKVMALERNSGKGYAIRTGMLNAAGKYRMFSDVDLSVPVETIDTFMKTAISEKSDVVIGTRKSKEAVILKKQPFYREYLGKCFTAITNLILNTPYSDITCGFKLFSAPAAEKIFGLQKIRRWSFDAEILYLAKELKFKTTEIPVVWINDPNSKVKLGRDIAYSLWELVKIRLMNRHEF